jgi:hypothetical protein
MRWLGSAVWVALTLTVFLASDVFDGSAVSAWVLAPVIALLPPVVMVMLSRQEQTSSSGAALHVVERRRGE